MLNEIAKKEEQEIIDKLYKIFPDLDKNKFTKFFSKLFNLKKKNNIVKEKFFQETLNDFGKLELLLERNEN